MHPTVKVLATSAFIVALTVLFVSSIVYLPPHELELLRKAESLRYPLRISTVIRDAMSHSDFGVLSTSYRIDTLLEPTSQNQYNSLSDKRNSVNALNVLHNIKDPEQPPQKPRGIVIDTPQFLEQTVSNQPVSELSSRLDEPRKQLGRSSRDKDHVDSVEKKRQIHLHKYSLPERALGSRYSLDSDEPDFGRTLKQHKNENSKSFLQHNPEPINIVDADDGDLDGSAMGKAMVELAAFRRKHRGNNNSPILKRSSIVRFRTKDANTIRDDFTRIEQRDKLLLNLGEARLNIGTKSTNNFNVYDNDNGRRPNGSTDTALQQGNKKTLVSSSSSTHDAETVDFSITMEEAMAELAARLPGSYSKNLKDGHSETKHHQSGINENENDDIDRDSDQAMRNAMHKLSKNLHTFSSMRTGRKRVPEMSDKVGKKDQRKVNAAQSIRIVPKPVVKKVTRKADEKSQLAQGNLPQNGAASSIKSADDMAENDWIMTMDSALRAMGHKRTRSN